MDMSMNAAREHFDDGGTRAPGDVEARHAVPRHLRAEAAALRPADDGKPAHPERVQPGALLSSGELQVCLCPAPRPVIFLAVEPRGDHPVAQRQLVRVVNAETPLFGRVDEEQSTERPECLTAEALLSLLVEADDLA